MEGQIQCSANFEPLSPVSFLERAASIYGDQPSVVYESLRFTWRETHQRCLNLASALSKLQIHPRDIVAAVAPNIPALYELHFAVPMVGAIISALNTKLAAPALANVLRQLDPKIIIVDYQFVPVVLEAFSSLPPNFRKPDLVLIPQHDQETTPIQFQGLNYNVLVQSRGADFDIVRPTREFDPISVSFTSGSTGDPKGVVYSHRAAYLNSLMAIQRCQMSLALTPVFLWTVDMFRCNGWCLTWAMAALGGTNICLRNVSARTILDAIVLHNVTHFCGAPTILNMIADASPSDLKKLAHKVELVVAGVLPSSFILDRVQQLGFSVSVGYGMTEALGPAIVWPCSPESTINYKVKSFHGMHNIVKIHVDVKNPKTMNSVPRDGTTVGEVMLRGNTLMSGYLKNPKATQEAFKDGWFRTGDLGVMNEDGHVQMKDRATDIIVSRGDLISSLEIESVLLTHPKVSEAAVVGKKDGGLGEVPWAFVKLKEGCGGASDEELIEFCEGHMEHFKVPRGVIFADLPRNSTGKVQKFVLREKVNGEDWAK